VVARFNMVIGLRHSPWELSVRLIRNYLGLSALLAGLGAVAGAQSIASLQTADTTLRLQAGSQAPRLLSLQNGQNPAWSNDIPEQLIASIEQDGRTVPLQWRLDTASSYAGARAVTFVYLNSSPRLRLTWKWEARAASGPIEHSIVIENLSPSEIWLPLQDSFRFRFLVDAAASLRHCYVEKGAGKPTDAGTHDLALPAGYDWTGR
jgi:alpha-galactosidase